MSDFDRFELRRLSDGLIYQFARRRRASGEIGYLRSDRDLWIEHSPEWGWISRDPDSGALTGRSWETLPRDQVEHPPAGVWVSRKNEKSYVYELVYV